VEPKHFIEENLKRNNTIPNYKELHTHGKILCVGWQQLQPNKIEAINNIFSGGETEFTPKTIHQTLTCPQRDSWIKAIDQKMDRINE
jgi:hypothetical protein